MKMYIINIFLLIILSNSYLYCMEQNDSPLVSKIADDTMKKIVSYLIGMDTMEVPKELETYIAFLNNDFYSCLSINTFLNNKLKMLYGKTNIIDLFQFSKCKYKETFHDSLEASLTVKLNKQLPPLFVLSASYRNDNGRQDFFQFTNNNAQYIAMPLDCNPFYVKPLAQQMANMRKGITKLKGYMPKSERMASLLPLFVQYCEYRNDEKLDVKISSMKQRMGRSWANTLSITIPFVVDPWVVEHILKKVYDNYLALKRYSVKENI